MGAWVLSSDGDAGADDGDRSVCRSYGKHAAAGDAVVAAVGKQEQAKDLSGAPVVGCGEGLQPQRFVDTGKQVTAIDFLGRWTHALSANYMQPEFAVPVASAAKCVLLP